MMRGESKSDDLFPAASSRFLRKCCGGDNTASERILNHCVPYLKRRCVLKVRNQ